MIETGGSFLAKSWLMRRLMVLSCMILIIEEGWLFDMVLKRVIP